MQGFSMGRGHKAVFLDTPNKFVPGPGSYNIDRSLGKEAPAYTFGERTQFESFDRNIVKRSSSPGPGRYF